MANRGLRGLLVACLVLSIGSVAVPARAAVRDSGSGKRADLVAELSAERGPDRRSVTESVTRVRDHSDRVAWMASIAEIIEQRSGGETSVAVASHEEEEEGYTGSYGEAVGAGDLDGDGSEDVVVVHYSLETDDILLEARRGRDGTPLWEQTSADSEAALAWPIGKDITNDGVADLLVYNLDILSEDITEECEEYEGEEYCWITAYEATYRWTIGVASGKDGAVAWTRTYDGELSESDGSAESTLPVPALDEFGYEYSFEGTNVDILPFVADLDAKGRDDLILNALDVSFNETYTDQGVWTPVGGAGQYGYEHQLRAVTRVDILDSLTGSVSRNLTQPSEAAIALAYPLPDRGGRTQLLLERSVEPDYNASCLYADVAVAYEEHCTTEEGGGDPSFEVALLDGQTLQELWKRAFTVYWGFTWPVGGDLDADGLDDIEVVLEGDEDWTSSYLTTKDGSELWSSPDSFVAVGQLDAEPGDDLISAAWAYDYEQTPSGSDTETETLTVQRRNGRTGAAWGEQTWTAKSTYGDENRYSWLDVSGGGDLDGDGAPDITVGKVSYTILCDEEAEECTSTPGASWGQAISGAAPRVLHRVDSDGYVRLQPTEDFDQDGSDEVAVNTREPVGEETHATFTAVRVADGAPLWTTQATGYFFYVQPTDDLDGDGGPDVLRLFDTLDVRRVQTSITALNGASGTAMWSAVTRP